jgi:hypothetical protein
MATKLDQNDIDTAFKLIMATGSFTDALICISQAQESGDWSPSTAYRIGGAVFFWKRKCNAKT